MAEQVNELVALIEPLARAFYGEPNRQLSSKTELRFGTHGSLSVDLEKGTWYDHETLEGGGTLDMVRRAKGFHETSECLRWMENAGYLNGRAGYPKRNGNGAHDDHQQHQQSALGKEIARYDYIDETGELLFQVVRYEPKDFRQRAPDIDGGWTWRVRGIRQVPYRLPELIEALANERMVVIVEGEKDADNLWQFGIPATTNAGGAGKWRSVLNSFFADADVVIIADNDPQGTDKNGVPLFHEDGRPKFTGQDHAHAVAAELINVAMRVRVFDLGKRWLDCPPKGDISDWIAAGGSVELLNDTIEQLPDWSAEQAKTEPATAVEPLAFFSAAEFENRELRDRTWLVPNRIPMSNVSLLGGDGATGKTTIALQLAVAVVRGTDWLKAMIDQMGSVLFFTAEEDEDEVHRRLKIMSDHFNFSFRDLANLQINCMPGQNSVLAKPDRTGEMKPTKLFERMELAIRVRRPRLICLESSADVFAGNEIDRPQVRQFVSLLRSWAMIDGAAVLLLSHPSLSGMGSGSGMSGSTAWNNSVRSRLYFSVKKGRQDEDDATRNDFRILEVKKANYGPSGETVECVWKSPGVFVPVEQNVDAPEIKANKERNAEHAFMRCLDVRNSHQQWVNQLESSHSRYAPKVFERMPEAEGFRAKQFATAMTRLLDKNMITIGKSPNTAPSKQFDILMRKHPTLV